MDLYDKIRSLPTSPGVYLYKNAEGEVIYVGKAKNLRARVRSYLLEASQANAKTGRLMREAVDLDYILVANEQEALALENNLIKQRHPRFNILLRDDKTYPYVKITLRDRSPAWKRNSLTISSPRKRLHVAHWMTTCRLESEAINSCAAHKTKLLQYIFSISSAFIYSFDVETFHLYPKNVPFVHFAFEVNVRHRPTSTCPHPPPSIHNKTFFKINYN